MRIVNGKFYDKDGKEVKPTFGNVAQIRALQERERMDEDGVVPAILTEGEITRYYPIIHFTCPKCGNENHEEMESETSDYYIVNSDVNQFEVECLYCPASFTVEAIEGSNMAIQLTYEQ